MDTHKTLDSKMRAKKLLDIQVNTNFQTFAIYIGRGLYNFLLKHQKIIKY